MFYLGHLPALNSYIPEHCAEHALGYVFRLQPQTGL